MKSQGWSVYTLHVSLYVIGRIYMDVVKHQREYDAPTLTPWEAEEAFNNNSVLTTSTTFPRRYITMPEKFGIREYPVRGGDSSSAVT